MNDESIVKIMQSLGMDYNPAIESTLKFQKNVTDLNKELAKLKANAMQGAKDINTIFSSQLGNMGNKQILDQWGKPFKTIRDEAKATSTTVKDMAKSMKESTLASMQAQAASVQQRATTKGLSQEYAQQAGNLREQLSIIQARLQAEGKLTAEEMRQTQQLKEQLDILKAQTRTEIADQKPNILDSEFQRRVQWFATGGVFYGMANATKEAVSTIKEVEMGMVELARIMDDPAFNLEKYRENLFQLGVDYGQTFENVHDIALRWAQAGYNVADSLRLTETALLALNTAELDAANATEAMVGIMAQWQLQAGDLELVIDKINKTADDYTVSSQDLVDGLLRSSSAARNMNMSIEETISLLTVMREASGRTGQEVGNALNSILSYIQRPKSIDTLEDMGIQVFSDKAKTQFRNAMDIFKDVAANWKNASDTLKDGFVAAADDAGLFSEEMATALGLQGEWNDLQKRDIAQASAGVYRRNYYIGMIERLANTQGILNNMMDAEGYSMSENAKTMDTLEKKVESFKASLERLAVAMGDAGYLEIMKDIVDSGTGLLEAFNNIDEGTQKAIISFTTMFGLLKAGEKALGFMGVSFGNLSKQAKDATATIGGFTLSLNGWITVAQLAVSIGFAAYNAWKQQQEAQKKAIETSKQSIQAYQEEISHLKRLSNEYDNISSKTETTEVEKSRLVDIQKELTSTFPELITGFDAEGNAMADNTSATKNLIEAKKELMAQELEALNILAQGRIPELKEEISETENRINELTNKLRSGDTKETVWLSHKEGITEVRDMSEKYAQEVVELSSKLKDMRGELSDLTGIVKQYDDAMVLQNGTLKEAREQLNMLDDVQLQNLKTVKDLTEADKENYITRLTNDKNFTEEMLRNTKSRIEAMQLEMNAMMALTGGKVKDVSAMSRMHTNSEIASADLLERASMLAHNKAVEANRELILLEGNLKDIDEALNNISNIKVSNSGTNSSRSSKDSKSKDKKDERKFLESIDAEIRAIKVKNDNLGKTEKLLQEQLNLAKDTEGLEGFNKQHELTSKLISHNLQMLMSFKNEQNSVHDMANKIRETYSKFNIDSWFDSNAEMTTAYIEEYNKATKKQQDEMDKVFSQVQKLKKAWMESATEIEKVNSNVSQLTISQEKLLLQVDKYLDQQREMARKEWIEAENRLAAEQQNRVKALDSIQELIVKLIRKRGEEEKKTLDEAHQAEMDSLEERHNERKKKYQEDLDLYRKNVQAQIDLLEGQWKEEDYQEQLRKEKEKADELQRQIDVLSLDDSLNAKNKVIQLRKQLAEQNEKISKMQRDRERDLTKETLQDQLKKYEESINEKEKIADNSYENDKKRLEEDYRINKEYLDRKYSDEKVYAEARESIIRGTVEVAKGQFMDIYDAYKDFENKFGRGMGILGDIIKRDFLDQLELAKDAIREMDYLAENQRRKYDSDYQPSDDEWDYRDPRDKNKGGNSKQSRPSEFMDWSESDYRQYVQNKKDWERSTSEYGPGGKNDLRIKNALLRSKYWGADRMHEDKYHWKDLENWAAKYDTGGLIPRDGLIYAHEKELYINSQQQNHLWNFIKKLPQINMPELNYSIPSTHSPTPQQPSITLKIDNLVRIDGNVTQETIPDLKEAVLDANQDLVNKLNKGGNYRPL